MNTCIILGILYCNIIISVLQISGAGLHLPSWIHRRSLWRWFRCLCSGSFSMLSWCSLSGFTPSCWKHRLYVSEHNCCSIFTSISKLCLCCFWIMYPTIHHSENLSSLFPCSDNSSLSDKIFLKEWLCIRYVLEIAGIKILSFTIVIHVYWQFEISARWSLQMYILFNHILDVHLLIHKIVSPNERNYFTFSSSILQMWRLSCRIHRRW